MGGASVRADLTAFALDALAIGVIVTDRNGRRLYANAAANRLLNQRAGALRCCSTGKVSAAHHAAQTDLHALISRACATGAASRLGDGSCTEKRMGPGGDFVLVPSPDAASPDLAICVLPVATGAPSGSEAAAASPHAPEATSAPTNAIILVRPIETDCNLQIEAQRLFGLTKAEARVASALASGASLEAAAKAQAVTLATARSHLKSIFRKTGLCRQSQVVALLRGAQIPLEIA